MCRGMCCRFPLACPVALSICKHPPLKVLIFPLDGTEVLKELTSVWAKHIYELPINNQEDWPKAILNAP